MKNINITIENDLIDEKSLLRLIDSFKRSRESVYPEKIEGIHLLATNHILEHINTKYFLDRKGRVLDIGCGDGVTIQKFIDKGFDTLGITLDNKDIQICNEKNLKVLKMDQSFLLFENNSFDLIWARHVLEHSIIPYHTLAEYKRVTKPDGIIYVEVPQADSICRQEENPNHYSIMTKTGWLELFNKNGLELLEVKILENELVNDDTNEKYMEEYWGFILRKPSKQIYLALSKGENFGWGVCSKYFNEEVPKLYNKVISEIKDENKSIDASVFHALTDYEFQSITQLRGNRNVGYTFFENELNENSIENSKKYDLILAGSTWCKEKMMEKGISNSDVLIQGIDPKIFYPGESKVSNNKFVIFSGGKFELRKGQDLVLKAIKILQQKYNDIYLVNAWFNMWPQSMQLMTQSKHIRFDIKGNNWIEFMTTIYDINGLDKNRIITYEIIPNQNLRELYLNTDIGLFPNRCEGGTNLVLMEYMACGKPVIASYNSGHKDILTENNSYKLTSGVSYKLFNNNKLWADWEEVSVDEIVEKIEYAYHNRNENLKIGNQAAEDLKEYTWEKAAKQLLDFLL